MYGHQCLELIRPDDDIELRNNHIELRDNHIELRDNHIDRGEDNSRDVRFGPVVVNLDQFEANSDILVPQSS